MLNFLRRTFARKERQDIVPYYLFHGMMGLGPHSIKEIDDFYSKAGALPDEENKETDILPPPCSQ